MAENINAYKKPDISQLASGEKMIYQAIQLWDYRSKLKADDFETAILKGIDAALSKSNLLLEKYPVFLPFRDTDEDDIVDPDKARVIYEGDMARLAEKTFAIIGFNDGLAKDSGECFEYGCAAALGIPSIMTLSDFEYFTNRYKDTAKTLLLQYVIDPVVVAGVGKIIVENTLPLPPDESPLPTSREIKEQLEKKAQFRKRLEVGMKLLYNRVAEETENICLHPGMYIPDIPRIPEKSEGVKTVYLAMEGLYQWQIEKMDELQETLEAEGFKVYRSMRFDPRHQKEFVRKYGDNAVVELGRYDLRNVIESDIVVTLGDGADMPAGPSFIQGYAKTLDKKVVLYYSGNQQIDAEGGTQTLVNLMLEYSADKIAYSSEMVVEYVKAVSQEL